MMVDLMDGRCRSCDGRLVIVDNAVGKTILDAAE